MFGKPPDVLPEDLNAEEYYELGLWYEETRLYQQARDAFERVVLLVPKTALSSQCKAILNSRLSRVDGIPADAINRLTRADLDIQFRPAQAKRSIVQLLEEFPDFEMAHRALAQVYLREGDVALCLDELKKALTAQPNHSPALALMARALAVDMEYDQALEYLRKAILVNPLDDQLTRLGRSIEYLRSLDHLEPAIV